MSHMKSSAWPIIITSLIAIIITSLVFPLLLLFNIAVLISKAQAGHVIITNLFFIIASLVILVNTIIVVLISKAQAGHVIITNHFFIIAILVILVNIIIVVLILTAQAGHYNGLCEHWVCEERPQHYRHPATVSS